MAIANTQSTFPAFALLLAVLWVNSADSAQADTEQTLVVFGDSLSAAYGIDEADGWVTLLSQRLAEQGFSYQVINSSVSGETTDGGLSRLPAVLDSFKPALVILELGGNDGLRGLPLTNIKQNLQAMVSLIQGTGAAVMLAGIQIPPNYGPRYTVPFYQQFQAIADDNNLPLLPFLIDGIPQQTELMQADGIHPKAEAQGLILDNVWPVLKPLLIQTEETSQRLNLD